MHELITCPVTPSPRPLLPHNVAFKNAFLKPFQEFRVSHPFSLHGPTIGHKSPILLAWPCNNLFLTRRPTFQFGLTVHWACEVAFGYRETENTTLGVLLHSTIKNLPVIQGPQEIQVRSLGGEDPLEEGTATLSSILAWRIP